MLEKVHRVFLVVFPFAHNDLARAKKFAIPDAREQAAAERNIDAIAIERVFGNSLCRPDVRKKISERTCECLKEQKDLNPTGKITINLSIV